MKYKVKSILFLGVGGISMHQLAILFKKLGVKVYGYDLHESKFTKKCEQVGVEIYNHFEKSICNVDLCVVTGAVKNKQFFSYLKKLNVPLVDRADVLYWICSKFKQVIAVAGTHGKTTTSTLIYETLRNANKKVSCHIGAEIDNARLDFKDEILVVEACEFNKSFLKLKPTISVITNIEKEHMDCYGNLFNLRSAFLTFLKKAENRFVYLEKSTQFLKKYGNINFVGNTSLNISPILRGEHNLKNISLAIEVCKYLGVSEKSIINTINNFSGVKRRYEFLGEFNNSKIYIDYAHHPTEVKAFTETFRSVNNKTQIAFQPHTFSRTKTFIKEFVEVLAKVENLIIYKEYSAREKSTDGMSAKELYLEIKKKNPHVKYCSNENSLIKALKPNHNIAFVGAGDINLVAEKLIKS